MRKNLILSICLFLAVTLQAQNRVVDGNLPMVFLIGENEGEYEQMVASYNTLLLSVCDNSMDKAYKVWTLFLQDFENFSRNEGVDIKGVKIWINVFWNANGMIDHIVYYPKPHSKNMDFSILTDLFERFVDMNQLEVTSSVPFSQYGSASFPVFSKYNRASEE
ncbi:MAG TPA: hypothetical protein PK147_03885 [Saprospiraceae bacterium]|nr:hypothetical protein [Saprospiraceae bacterium]